MANQLTREQALAECEKLYNDLDAIRTGDFHSGEKFLAASRDLMRLIDRGRLLLPSIPLGVDLPSFWHYVEQGILPQDMGAPIHAFLRRLFHFHSAADRVLSILKDDTMWSLHAQTISPPSSTSTSPTSQRALSDAPPISVAGPTQRTDLAVITILPEEYEAMTRCLQGREHVRGTSATPNQYAWQRGTIVAGEQTYRIVVALAGEPTNTISALVATATIGRFHPRYLAVVGVAGGFEIDGQTHGDVVVSTVIASYEYGKIDNGFHLRKDQTFRSDANIITAAKAVTTSGTRWWENIAAQPPVAKEKVTVRFGQATSGNKVVDDVRDQFFAAVLAEWPKALIVEMEGAGAAAAVERAQAAGLTVGFMMIRGISDMPGSNHGAGTEIRDGWKRYAAEAAARFLVELLTTRWPLEPLSISGDAESSFGLGRPIEVDALRAIQEDVSRIRAIQENVQLESAPDQIARLLRTLEARNPGLRFEARSTNVGTQFHVRADKRLEVSAPTFPNTPVGRIGAEKFRSFIEEGRTIDLEPDEYQWTSPVNDGGLVAPPGAERSLRLEPKIPDHKIPVILRWVEPDSREVDAVPLTFLRINRLGTREGEISISGGRLAGTFTLLFKREVEAAHNIDFSLDIASVSAADAHATLDLVLRFGGPGTFAIVDAVDNLKLFEASGLLGDRGRLEKLRDAHSLTADLALINRELKKELRYPATAPSHKDALTAELLASALRHGGPIAIPSDGEMSLLFDQQEARDAIASWKTGALTFSGKRTEPFKLFGVAISVEEMRGVDMYIQGSTPVDDLEELAKRAEADAAERIAIKIRAERVLYDFPEWHPKVAVPAVTLPKSDLHAARVLWSKLESKAVLEWRDRIAHYPQYEERSVIRSFQDYLRSASQPEMRFSDGAMAQTHDAFVAAVNEYLEMTARERVLDRGNPELLVSTIKDLSNHGPDITGFDQKYAAQNELITHTVEAVWAAWCAYVEELKTHYPDVVTWKTTGGEAS